MEPVSSEHEDSEDQAGEKDMARKRVVVPRGGQKDGSSDQEPPEDETLHRDRGENVLDENESRSPDRCREKQSQEGGPVTLQRELAGVCEAAS